MDKYTLGEVAYKNGYEKGFQDGVKSLEAEIEILKAKCENTQIGYNFANDEIKNLKKEKYKLLKALNQSEDYKLITKTEAYKEFMDKVNENRTKYFNYIYSDDGFANITNTIYKELTEKKEDEKNVWILWEIWFCNCRCCRSC